MSVNNTSLLQKITLQNFFGIIRGQTLKRKVSKIGKFPFVKGKVNLKNDGVVEIGNNLSIRSTPYPVSIVIAKNAELNIGNHVYINFGVDIGCTSKITIGNNVLIGSFVNIIDSNFHSIDSCTKSVSKPINISENVWIGNHCIILPGVQIGQNSVVAAGSVVNKDVPENVMVAGNPAKIKKKLNIQPGWIRK